MLLRAQEFKAGKSPIMLATDVAARGLGMQTPLWVSQKCHFHAHLDHKRKPCVEENIGISSGSKCVRLCQIRLILSPLPCRAPPACLPLVHSACSRDLSVMCVLLLRPNYQTSDHCQNPHR